MHRNTPWWHEAMAMGRRVREQVAAAPLRPVTILGQAYEARDIARRAQRLHQLADEARQEPERCARLRREAVDLQLQADRLCPVEYR